MWSISVGEGCSHPIRRILGGSLYGLLDFGHQDCRVEALRGAGPINGDLAAAAEIDAVLLEDSHGGGEFGGDLADGAIGGGGGHASIVRAPEAGVGDRSHRACSRR